MLARYPPAISALVGARSCAGFCCGGPDVAGEVAAAQPGMDGFRPAAPQGGESGRDGRDILHLCYADCLDHALARQGPAVAEVGCRTQELLDRTSRRGGQRKFNEKSVLKRPAGWSEKAVSCRSFLNCGHSCERAGNSGSSRSSSCCSSLVA